VLACFHLRSHEFIIFSNDQQVFAVIVVLCAFSSPFSAQSFVLVVLAGDRTSLSSEDL